MLTYKTDAFLSGCGVDSEQISRFDDLERKKELPSPLIFTKKEIVHCYSLTAPGVGFCAAFCCKEAVFKAVEKPCNLTDCELFWLPERNHYNCVLSGNFRSTHNVSDSRVFIELTSSGECVARVLLFGS